MTSGSAHFVERFIGTFKLMISQRMKVLKKAFRLTSKQPPIDTSKYQWSDLIPNVLAEHNHKNKHRITSMTPAEAKKPSNDADAKMAMELVARRGRQYTNLRTGDIVSILRKKKVVGDKEWMGQFKK